MTRDEWKRSEPILTQALMLPEADREALLGTVNLEEALRRDIMQMLRRGVLGSPSVAIAGQPSTPSSPLSSPPGSPPASPSMASPGRGLPALVPGGVLANGRYVIVRQIGRGGMGAVYLGHDTTFATLVALKVMPYDERLLAEARRAAVCSDHPHVATIHNVLQERVGDQDLGILVMEYVAGTPASQLLDDGPLDVGRVLRWGRQIAAAIAHAHEHQVLHCDLKPANIVITADGRAKVLDFGISRATFEAEDSQEPVRGTVPYMPPEQLLWKQFSPAGDIYSLGVTLFEFLTGQLPFDGEGKALRLRIVAAPPPSATELVPDVPPELQKVLEKAMAKAPDQRFRSARSFERALEAAESGVQYTTGSVPVPASVAVPSSKQTWLRLLIGTVTAPVLITALGIFNTATFNLTFGRGDAFGREPLARWFEMGLRSVVAPGFYIGAALVAMILLSVITRTIVALVPPLGLAVGVVRTRVRSIGRRSGLSDPIVSLRVLIAVGAIALSVFLMTFQDFIGAYMSDISTATDNELARLRPENEIEHVLYRRVLELILLATVFGIVRIRAAANRRGTAIPKELTAAAVAVPVFAFALCEIPYRTVFWSEFPRVDLEEMRCYQIGSGGDRLLLHCPDAEPPRNRDVPANDKRLIRRDIIESVFR
jgi:hypothetical protein